MTNPPLEYLVTSSQAGLETFELARLNKIANLRKELREIVEEWIEAETQSRLARWILQCRRTQDAASNPQDSELSPLPVEDVAEDLLPASRQTQDAGESPYGAGPLSKRSPRYRRGLSPAPPALSLLRPQLSARAVDTLNFLEQHVRLQTDALFSGICDAATEAGRNVAFPDSAQVAVRRLRLHESSRTEPLFPASLASSEAPRSDRAQTHQFPGDKLAKSDRSKTSSVADSARSADTGHLVPLLRRKKMRPAPVRAPLRYSPPQRHAL